MEKYWTSLKVSWIRRILICFFEFSEGHFFDLLLYTEIELIFAGLRFHENYEGVSHRILTKYIHAHSLIWDSMLRATQDMEGF